MISTQRNKKLERLIVQSYVWLLREPRTVNGHKVASLFQNDEYEVRLLESSEMSPGDTLPFRVELFDKMQNVSLESHAGDDLEEAARVAQCFISRARSLTD